MAWLAIVEVVIRIFGPILAEWLRKWLEKRLREAAEQMPECGDECPLEVRVNDLFEKAAEGTGPFRRALLLKMKQAMIRRILFDPHTTAAYFAEDTPDRWERAEIAPFGTFDNVERD